MGTVIGYKGNSKSRQSRWNLLRFYKEDIRYYKETGDPFFSIAMDKEKAVYDELLNRYVS